MDTTSYWIDSAAMPQFSPLKKNLKVDVVVVGGGLTGLTTAYLLKQAGKSVAVLERDRCAMVDTGHTTAHVTAVTDLSRGELKSTFGKEAARAVWDAGVAAMDQIVKNIRREDIACDFRWVPGYLHAPLDLQDPGKLEHERDWLKEEARVSNELGIDVRYLDHVPFIGLPGLQFAHQAIFHPRKYLAALAASISGEGSHVFEQTAAGEIESEPLGVKANGYLIRCERLVFCTHNPLMGTAGALGAALFQTKLALYSTYAVGTKLPSGVVPSGSYWDTSEPYNYLRVEPRRGHDYAIFGGEDHKTGQAGDTTERYRRLEARLKRIIAEADVDFRWSGQVIDTNDGLPFIGEMAEHQFAATGFAGNGMTFGTLGAMMAVDWVLGRKNPWQDLFDPSRKKLLGGTWSYLTENKDYPFFMVRDWLGGAEGESLHELARDEGKILNLGGKKVAAFRNDMGEVSLCSPICTHLKCIVGWNSAEKTWDCPCHGSRFKPTGEVISGPAEDPLERLPTPVSVSSE
jgi:glycine/D-amino acid oxidase-like deaminating enzyme/nitrite reductase/ring-hydroxylating ferredoxin subunit